MAVIQAIILGAIQGLTEFIPVSSSGHLKAIPALLGWKHFGMSFDVALHMGTLLAVVLYFWKDWIRIIGSFISHITKSIPYGKKPADSEGKLFIPIIIACIPAGIVGFFLDDFIEKKMDAWYLIAIPLVVVGVVMLLADKMGNKRRSIDKMSYIDYLTIGGAQALALFPGVSRSGITISAGLFRNLDRAAAARFSFLLSTPIIFGAGLKKMKDLMGTGMPSGEMQLFLIGAITAAIFGYISIKFMMRYLEKKSLNVFVWYRFAFAVFMAIVFLRK